MSIRTLRFTCPKDNPLRKPTPVYAGSMRRSSGVTVGRWIGLYVHLGSRCFGVICERP